MTVSVSANRINKKIDLLNLAILVVVAFGIGFYLIATTVLISKDGVFYIEQARKFASEPAKVIKEHSFGYPFLIYILHKLISLFNQNSTIHTWIYAAQSVSLLCRLLALIPLYYIGKLLVGRRMSFFGLLIFLVLPYPARYGSDALRDWPHILFLATGFLLLLLGARQNKCWMYGAVGLVAGLGFMVRQECAQLVLFGSSWLMVGLFFPKKDTNKSTLMKSLVVLVGCFVLVVTPYIMFRGRLFIVPSDMDISVNRTTETCNRIYSASSFPFGILKVINEIAADISENLMFYFVPAWLIGIFYHFRRRAVITDVERFFIPMVLIFNLIMLIIVGANWGYTSRRYSLPLLALTCFYIPVGLKYFSDLIERKFLRSGIDTNRFHLSWFIILLGIGIILCLPKLFKPVNSDKGYYRKASQWLVVNTSESEFIAVPDIRIGFYAQRQALIYEEKIPERANYVVAVINGRQDNFIEDEVPGVKQVFSAVRDGGISDIEIYDLRGYISKNVSLSGYRWEKAGDEEYVFNFTFKVKDSLLKDWTVYFHGRPDQRENNFENWDFYPEPVTSLWLENESVTIRHRISTKPAAYYVELGFYRAGEGRYGRGVNLGLINLGEALEGGGW